MQRLLPFAQCYQASGCSPIAVSKHFDMLQLSWSSHAHGSGRRPLERNDLNGPVRCHEQPVELKKLSNQIARQGFISPLWSALAKP